MIVLASCVLLLGQAIIYCPLLARLLRIRAALFFPSSARNKQTLLSTTTTTATIEEKSSLLPRKLLSIDFNCSKVGCVRLVLLC